MNSIQKSGFALTVLVSWALSLHAEVKPNTLFADDAVLQQGQRLPVWGTARDSETVRVEFAGQTQTTVAKPGKWTVRLSPLAAGGPYTMNITGENNALTLTKILVGDVWLASGQSNLQDPLGPTWWAAPVNNWQAEVAAANYPQIRRRPSGPMS